MRDSWASTLGELDALRATCAAANIDLVLALVPIRQVSEESALAASLSYVDFESDDFDFAKANDRLAAYCTERGLRFCNPVPAFVSSASSGSELYLPNDMHFSPAGHRLFAESVADLVRAGLLNREDPARDGR